MAKSLTRSSDPDLYETDYYLWLEQQAELLREGRLEDIDALNLIEEMDDLAIGERASVESHAATIIEHLLKLEHSPAERPRRGWRLTVARDRGRLAKRLSATLRAHLARKLNDAYQDGCRAALIGLEPDRIKPDLSGTCPYTLEQVLDPEWLPENLHGIKNPVS